MSNIFSFFTNYKLLVDVKIGNYLTYQINVICINLVAVHREVTFCDVLLHSNLHYDTLSSKDLVFFGMIGENKFLFHLNMITTKCNQPRSKSTDR